MGLVAGLLGFAKGAAGAVETLSDEKRAALAEKLKMDALEQMDIRRSAREHGYRAEELKTGHGYAMESQTVDAAARAREAAKGRAHDITQGLRQRESTEKIAGARLTFNKAQQAATEAYNKLVIESKKASTNAAVKKNMLEAISQVNKIKQDDGGRITPENIDIINNILRIGGVSGQYGMTGEPGEKRKWKADKESTLEATWIPDATENGGTPSGSETGTTPGTKPKTTPLQAQLDKLLNKPSGNEAPKEGEAQAGTGEVESPSVNVTPKPIKKPGYQLNPENTINIPEGGLIGKTATEKQPSPAEKVIIPKGGLLGDATRDMRGPLSKAPIKIPGRQNAMPAWIDKVRIKDGKPYIVSKAGKLAPLTRDQRALWDNYIRIQEEKNRAK